MALSVCRPLCSRSVIRSLTNHIRYSEKYLNEESELRKWKRANVPIFKTGNREIAQQYRPLSLTGILCEMIEKIIRKQTDDYFGGKCFLKVREKRLSITSLMGFWNRLSYCPEKELGGWTVFRPPKGTWHYPPLENGEEDKIQAGVKRGFL